MTEALPSALLDQRLAIVGTAGSGKSYSAKGFVERLLRDGARVAVIDPTGVWYGLRSSADGAGPGFPVVVFGGLHADVELQEGMGAPLGRLIATHAIASIIDLSELGSSAARRRFMGAFFDALYATNREPLHLVVDEADLFAPQRPLPDGLQLLGHMEEIVRRGRVRGFIPWLITQRPAVLHKDVLSQADVLIAMKLTSSQDRDAIGAWIEGQADRADGKRILADLPRMPRGTGYVWAPGDGILERVTFPAITTFDSSRTPARGERLAAPQTLAQVDLTAITAALAIDADAHAPKKGKQAPAVSTDAQHALVEAARTEGYARGLADGRADGRAAVWAEIKDRVDQIAAAVAGLRHSDMSDAKAWRDHSVTSAPRHDEGNGVEPPRQRRATGAASTVGGRELNSAARKLLTAAAQHAPAKFTWGQLSTLAGLKPSGGHFNTGKRQLLDRCLVNDPDNLVRATPDGLAAAGTVPAAPSTPAEILSMWCDRLPSPAPDMLRALVRHGSRFIEPTALAAELGKESRGGHWNTGVSILKANLLVELEGRAMRAAALLRG